MYPNEAVNTVSSAVFHYVRTPFAVLLGVFAVIVIVTVALAVHEIKNDPS